MPPLELKGNTLGEKHKYYNEQLKKNIEIGSSDKLTNISYDECDIDNLFKIDIASKKRNVDYILEVLKCEDMLFVARAIKRSKWLITDDKYSHFVNPSYLHTQLFPDMSSKATSKFMLTIRLHLKNESRVEEFFNFYKEKNLSVALKWLPNCSITFIERAIQAYCRYISVDLLKRLCNKSKTLLQIYLKEIKLHDKGKEKEATKFLKNTNVNKYLDIIETLESYEFPVFSAKFTKTVMKIAPNRILNNFEKYAFHIHLPTFVKSRSLKSDNADRFLLELYKNCHLHSWFQEDNLKPFLLIMPSTKRSNFVKNFLIDRKFDDVNLECKCARDLENDYSWYKYVDFETAFVELKRLIHAESSPSERINILKVLLYSARQDMKNIHFLLKYFRDKHINEPNVFKTSFIADVVKQILTFRLKEETWQILNEVFRSMDVYTESQYKKSEKTQFCINVVLIRRILNDELISESIAEKCLYETLGENRKHLNEHESGKVFNYLYQYKLKKLQEQSISTKLEFEERENMVFHLLTHLSQWGKDLADFPLVLIEIHELVEINNKNLYNVNLSRLYNVNKVWRKSMFADALDLQPSQEVFVNALKHDPNISLTMKSKLQSLYFNNDINIKQFLYKVRTYWSSSIASDNISFLLEQIHKGNGMSLIPHVFLLLPKKPLVELVTKYAPEKAAIQWDSNDADELLDIQKNIARYLHYPRPPVSFEVITWYAKGDYLKFAIPSLTAVLSNMSSNSLRYHIKHLMNTPVALRKHAIRIASDKLKCDEVVDIFASAWMNTDNKSIRAVLFEHTFKILCRQKNNEVVKPIWQLLDKFIDTLTDGENEVIYNTLTKVNRAPHCVRVAFWKKSYKFLSDTSIKVKSVAPKVISTVTSAMQFMEIVDIDFFAEILDQNKGTVVGEANHYYLPLISRCLLETISVASQNERYEKVFLPVMKLFLSQWNKQDENDYMIRRTFCELLKCLCNDFIYIVVPNKMVVPAIVFNEIKEYLEHNLPADENYVLVTSWKLVSTYLNILSCDKTKTDHERREEAKAFENIITNECDKALTIAKFGQKSLQYLIGDMKLCTTLVHISFARALEFTFDNLDFNYTSKFLFIKSFLNFDILESYLVALILLPQHVSDRDKQEKIKILDILCSHTSPEVKMSCYLYKEQSYL